MRLLYITNLRFPTEKAHGIQMAKMCDAFSQVGVNTTLAAPMLEAEHELPDQDYDLSRELDIKRISVWGMKTGSRIQFILRSLFFFLNLIQTDTWKEADIIYVRDKILAFLLSFTSKEYVWEIHQDYSGWKVERALTHAKAVVLISDALEEYYLKTFDISKDKIILAPDAVGQERFEDYGTKEECREKLGLPLDKKIVLYSGHLYPWKGVDTLAEAAEYVSNGGVQIVFLGGTEEDVNRFKDTYGHQKNISILGRKPYKEMPYYKQAADILVIPNTAENSLSESFSSPMKLFSSMAAGKPIVATKVRSLYSIINDSMTYFCKPDDPKDMAETIEHVVENYMEAKKKAANARQEAKKFTWKRRSERIIDFVK